MAGPQGIRAVTLFVVYGASTRYMNEDRYIFNGCGFKGNQDRRMYFR